MPIEGHGDGSHLPFRRRLDGPADHLAMAEMHAVEEPDRDDAGLAIQREGVEPSNDLHAPAGYRTVQAPQGARITSGTPFVP